ncbi:MAG: acyltransferase [Proteobacteria bacterium]|nr:acyltransferase [Pseudomonadota bacterium]
MGAENPAQKQHFVFLDGLRGVAALLVGWLHASQVFSLSYRPAHAFLAVDFFFCLSGFVIAHAYDEKLDRGMAFSDFALKRLVRLYPMILCGVLLGGALALVGSRAGPILILAITVSSLALLPVGLMSHVQAYPINNPIWSLFFELAANAAYGLERRVMRVNAALPAILILLASGLALVAVAYGQRGIEEVGFSSVSTFFEGFVRVTYPFFAGVFIYRFGVFKLRFSAPSLAVAMVLIAVLAAPIFQRAWGYDAFAVIGLFPAIVILGANASRSGSLSKLWTLLGKLSYPFYIVHQPILRATGQIQALTHLPSAFATTLPALSMLAAAISAYLILRLYDEPARRWLTARLAAKVRSPSIPGACLVEDH